jgi:hypothetical protein
LRGLQALPDVHLSKLPRMADFALWATACEPALWPAGTFARAYDANRQAAVEGLIDADLVAICVRRLMAQRASWSGTASDLLRAATYLIGDDISKNSADWPRYPGALAGRLRRAQTFLRTLGMEISFSREGRAGTRKITISSAESCEMSVSAVSSVSANCHSHKHWGIGSATTRGDNTDDADGTGRAL